MISSRAKGGKHAARRPRRRGRLAISVGVALVLAVAGSLSLEVWDASQAPASSSDDHARASLPVSPGDDTGARQRLDKPSVASKDKRVEAPADTDLPADSGSGRRVVFSQDAQRTWLVDARGRVLSTYLVSGSLTDNLDPGTYDVYSRSRWAVGVGDSGVMEYMVRFTRGDNGVAIGFHTIPTRFGVPLQSPAQLGTPQSHGCIRQRTRDAKLLWEFAYLGTTVVVVAGD